MKNVKNVLVLAETSRQFGRNFIKGILEYCKYVHEWKFEFFPPPFYIKQARSIEYKKHLQDNDYDGVIGYVTSPLDFKFIIDTKTPAVLQCVSTPIDEEAIIVENKEIGIRAADYFIEKSFENFGFFGCRKLRFSNERLAGFSERGDNKKIHEYSTGMNNTLNSSRAAKITQWLKKLPKPIAVFTCNDDWAKILSEVCIAAEISIPEDVSILGVDNDEIVCETTWPNISSICLNTQKAGFKAAELLDTMISAKRPTNKVITINHTHIEERRSTDITITKDQLLSSALQYIRTNIDKPIQVTDILQHVSISRRSLQDKFQKNLGSSVLTQIRKMQIERVARLLTETDLSITTIADQSGFTSFNNLSRVFKKYKDTSPSEYRKSNNRFS